MLAKTTYTPEGQRELARKVKGLLAPSHRNQKPVGGLARIGISQTVESVVGICSQSWEWRQWLDAIIPLTCWHIRCVRLQLEKAT
jgi:hypothetical protein